MEKDRNEFKFLIIGGAGIAAAYFLYNSMKLTKNFWKEEVSKSSTAIREGIRNEPSRKQMKNAERLAENVLQPVRDRLNKSMFVSSWFRSNELNERVGGSPSSYHLEANAADVTTKGDNGDIWKAVLETGVPFTEMIIEYGTLNNPRWVHLAYDGRNIRQIKRFESIDGRTRKTRLNENDLRLMV